MSKKILFTFAGNTDPTRGEHDGPIIHICRHYSPDKIYLILTKEMEKRDSEPHNIYEKAIKENLKNYNPEIIRIKTGIEEAHYFDIYFNWIYETFEKIKKEDKDAEIYLNMTSGTPQMIANLVSYYIDSTDLNIIPLQVSTHEGKSNTEPPVNESYDVKKRAEENIDNQKKNNRIVTPDLKQYSRILVKNQIKKLIEQYNYFTSLELLKRDVFKDNRELISLLEFAIERKNLNKKANDKLIEIDSKKHEKLFYCINYNNQLWYSIVEYFSLASIKEKSGDISGYILMLEPLVSNIYIFILENILKRKLNSLFKISINNKNNTNMEYRVDVNKLEPSLKKQIEKDMGIRELKDGSYVYTPILVSIIKYYLKNKTFEDMNLSYFKSLSEIFESIKEIRNILAHTLTSISKKDFEFKSKKRVDNINKAILNFFEKFYTPLGYKKEMVEVYDNINKEIVKLLK